MCLKAELIILISNELELSLCVLKRNSIYNTQNEGVFNKEDAYEFKERIWNENGFILKCFDEKSFRNNAA